MIRRFCIAFALIILFFLVPRGTVTSCSAQEVAPITVPSQSIAPAAVTDPYTPHLPARAYAYFRAHRILFFFGLGWHVLGLYLLLRLGLSIALRDRLMILLRLPPHSDETRFRPRPPSFRLLAGYFIVYTLLLLLWTLPVGLGGLAIEWQYGFSRQTVLSYLQDDFLGLALGWLAIPLYWIIYWLYARSPRLWWMRVWAALIPVSFFAMVLYPQVISPLYNRYTPLQEGPLKQKLLELAGKAGITGGRVFVEDTSRRTSHVNAYVIGIGSSARIVLNDTALQQLPEDQILAMMGHEMGHYVEGHIWVGLILGSLGSGLILWLMSVVLPRLEKSVGPRFHLRGLHDVAALPLIFLVIYLLNLAGDPIVNGVSRTLEKRADAFGLRVTGLNDATARLMVGFAERDFSDPDPPRLLHLWFGTHPTIRERIDFALRYPSEAPHENPAN